MDVIENGLLIRYLKCRILFLSVLVLEVIVNVVVLWSSATCWLRVVCSSSDLEWQVLAFGLTCDSFRWATGCSPVDPRNQLFRLLLLEILNLADCLVWIFPINARECYTAYLTAGDCYSLRSSQVFCFFKQKWTSKIAFQMRLVTLFWWILRQSAPSAFWLAWLWNCCEFGAW